MSVSITFAWHPYRYFPYEQRLARREIMALLGASPKENGAGLNAAVSTEPPPGVLERLTYFREVRVNGSPPLFPVQAQLEVSASTKAGLPLFTEVGLPLLKRQSTRYSAHGLHEYRGKFHPHIVRVIGNLLGVSSGAWVADPFCGSGTTLLEAAHAGWNAIGIDTNPLGTFISNTKIGALRVDPSILSAECERLANRLLELTHGIDFEAPFVPAVARRVGRSLSRNPLPNLEYLEAWFPISVLQQLAAIQECISEIASAEVRNIARVVLSDCLREVSLQDPADLRIRRRKDARGNYPAIPIFVAALTARVATVMKARELLPPLSTRQEALLGDSRQGMPRQARLPKAQRLFDGVITSPPYATALPYIDTQRLSLAFLGFVDRVQIRQLEAELIGAREITGRDRRAEEAALARADDSLPPEVVALCRRALQLAASPQDGFRRKNVPALLFRYFRDMRAVFASMIQHVRPGGFFAALVGPNKSTLGGEVIEIDTPSLLAAVAERVGWQCSELVQLDAYQRFDLHRSNSITREALIVLRRPETKLKTTRTASRPQPRQPRPAGCT